MIRIIITEAGGLHGGSPFRDLAPTFIIAVAGGVTHCIGNHSWLIVCGIVSRSGYIPRGICHSERAPGGIRHHGGGITAAICLHQHHATGGKAACGRGHNTRRVLLRERKSIHHHRFGGDIRCGDSTVLRSFRAVIIDRPIRRSQAAFVDNERFVFRRTAKYSLHPHVVFHHVLWGHENLPPGMKLIQRRAHVYRNFENYRLRV